MFIWTLCCSTMLYLQMCWVLLTALKVQLVYETWLETWHFSLEGPCVKIRGRKRAASVLMVVYSLTSGGKVPLFSCRTLNKITEIGQGLKPPTFSVSLDSCSYLPTQPLVLQPPYLSLWHISFLWLPLNHDHQANAFCPTGSLALHGSPHQGSPCWHVGCHR